MKKLLYGTSALLVALMTVAPAAEGTPAISHAPRLKATGTVVTNASYGWQSSNWSGYAISTGTFHDITGSWVVPAVKSGKGSSYSSTWIGIDGYNNSDLIQTGTEQDYSNGSTHYYAWWEILPAAETQIDPTKYPVSPGDKMSASIHNNGNGTWTITISDTTKNWSFPTTQNYTGPANSAEWIEEAPTIGGRVATLANYGQVTIDPGTVNGVNPNFNSTESGAMVKNGQVISSPSLPDGDTDGFNAAYGSAQPAAPAS